MPAIHGRVCYHPVKAPVIVGISMRPSAFTRWNGSWVIRRSRKGGGWRALHGRGRTCWSSAPVQAGLSTAYHLARMGHQVTIHEAGPQAGGMMRYGIPKYRLPREIVDAEVAEFNPWVSRLG